VNGEICPQCCGTEREVTVDCPFECEFLQEARKREKPPELDVASLPNRDIRVSREALDEKRELLEYVSHRLLQSAQAIPGVVDFDVREALEALIRTYRTLKSGIYYDTLPENRLAGHLYRAVQEGLEHFRQQERERLGMSRTRDADVLLAMVFLQRLEIDRNNGRRRGRAFLDLLHEFYGEPPEASSRPSLILP